MASAMFQLRAAKEAETPGGTLSVEVIGMLVGNFFGKPKYTQILILKP